MTRKSGILFLVSAVLGLLISLGTAQARQSVEGSAKADQLDQCVRETPFMRRNHFEMIKHQRDLTVHQGVRKTDESLAQCVDCHAGTDAAGKPVPVDAEGEFCESCHAYTAVSLDCFSCHRTVPGEK